MEAKMACAWSLAACFALAVGSAAAADARKCDTVLRDGRCLQIIDGKVFIDGKEDKKVVVHTDQDAQMQRADLPPAPANVRRVMAQVPAHKLQGELTLPKLFVFDAASGKPVDAKRLPPAMASYLQSHGSSPLPAQTGATPLQVAMNDAIAADGHALDASDIGAAKFVLVQWWAGWCSGCLAEGKQLAQLFRDNPMPEIRWIAIETDPTKNANASSGG